MRDENHFVQAEPAGPTADDWVHLEALRCRWIPILADTSVYGEHGAFLDRLLRKRVVGYVTRGRELLVFDHKGMPDVPAQVPAGRVDSHESLEEALLREVEEESGITGVTVVRELADAEEFEHLFGPGAHESHAFHATAELGGPDEWEHPVSGTGMELVSGSLRRLSISHPAITGIAATAR